MAGMAILSTYTVEGELCTFCCGCSVGLRTDLNGLWAAGDEDGMGNEITRAFGR